MKITVQEAFVIVKLHLLKGLVNYELVLFGDDELNARAILALVDHKPSGLNALNLIHLGLVRNYDEAVKLIEKARKTVDKK